MYDDYVDTESRTATSDEDCDRTATTSATGELRPKYDDYMTTQETATFLGVCRRTVERWRSSGALLPDVIGHGKNGRGGVYYYSKERVLQLASVYTPHKGYRKDTSNPVHIADDKQSRLAETETFLPMTTAPNFDAIPQVLKDLPRWLCWQLRHVDGRLTKVPMTPKNGKLVNAAVNKTENWLPFNEAISWYKRGLCSGIGFALCNTPPKVCCIDVDHCFNADGTLTAEAQAVIETCQNSFTEKSQSGGGIHVWFIDDDFDSGRRKGNVEVYAADRYIAMTGVRVPPSSTELLQVNGACRNVIAKFIGDSGGNLFDKPAREADEKTKINLEIETAAPLSLDDRRLVEYFHSDKCRQRDLNMFELFGGNTVAYFKNTEKPVDDSVADCDLMLKILYYIGGSGTNADIGHRALKIFGQSELAKREKWLAREDYRLRTLNAAFNIWNENGREATKPMTTNKDGSAQIDSLKADLREVNKALAEFDAEKNAALERLREVEKFDRETVFSEDILQAAAFARFAEPKAFSDFRSEIKNYGDKHKDEKVHVNDWLNGIKDRIAEIATRQAALLTRKNEIQAQIKSLSFIADNDALSGFKIPKGYSVSDNGIAKVAGENLIPVCRRPVIITGKTFSVDEKISKWNLAYLTENGKLEILEPTEAATVFDRTKLVKLSNKDLPVTSSNANLLVDYLDAFKWENESTMPLTYCVNRCGWYNFNGKDVFIDPRRECVIQDFDDDRKISVKVDDSKSDFANHLKQVGDLEKWKQNAYLPAKKSPVARLVVAASVAAPLLYVLGERNFMVYICAPTRAGKTTALNLLASAVGSDKIIRSFDATKNGLAGAAADVNDYVFCVDERQVADNKFNEQIANIVYALSNGVGRTKLNKDSSLRKLQDWRTIVVLTGETLLLPDNVTGGAFTRLLTIKAQKEILDADTCKKIRETTKHNYGLVMPLVINEIFKLGFEKLRELFDEMIDTFAVKYPEILPEHRRYMAVLTLADTLLNSVLFGNKAIAPDGATITASDDATINATKIFPLIPTIAEIADAPRAKDWLLGQISLNQNHFVGGNVDESKIQGIWGSLNDSDGYIYITVSFVKELCKKYDRDYRKLVNDLVDAKIIIPSDKTPEGNKKPNNYVQKKIAKINTRCYRIPQSAFDDEEE